MRKIISFLLLYSLFVVCSAATSYSLPDGEEIEKLQAQHKAMLKTQDSLQNLLNQGRGLFASATAEQKKEISSDIIRYEEELFEIKSQLSQIGSKLAAIESELATESLNKIEMQNMSEQSKLLYDNAFVVNNISNSELVTLKNLNSLENEVVETITEIQPLYNRLQGVYAEYETTRNQRVLDSLYLLGNSIIAEINSLDREVGQKWLNTYDRLLETFVMLLDKSPNTDRFTLEAIEIEGREVRREQALLQQGSMTPKLAAFDVERKYLISYQSAIAQAASLDLAYEALESIELVDTDPDFKQVEFLPRILVLYSDVDLAFDYPYTEVDDVPEMIIPEQGVYYTVQIALMSKKPTEVAFFKGVGPMQVETISPTRLRYCVAGFNNYAQANEAVAILKKKGLKAPTLICYYNGEVTTTAIAKAKESEVPVVGSFKVVVTSSATNISEIVRESMEMHTKGKSVIRMAQDNGGYEFTITEFASKLEADVFAQILRTKSSESKIEVLEIEKE